MSIEIRDITKQFGRFTALQPINLTVPTGKLTSLLGPSGCGKTTLLRIIAGLELADTGRILFDGEDVTDVPVQQRNIGFMFQHYALFRHMTVFDNVAFGALDAKVRKELRAWLRSIHHELGVTSILVTHDQEEAAELSDEIVVMNQGQIVQIGDYETLVNHPSNHFVANFLQDSHVEYVI